MTRNDRIDRLYVTIAEADAVGKPTAALRKKLRALQQAEADKMKKEFDRRMCFKVSKYNKLMRKVEILLKRPMPPRRKENQ